MVNKKISDLTEITGNTAGSYLIVNNSQETETNKITKENFLSNINTSVSITGSLNLTRVNSLPEGNIGDLVVSGSNLCFYDGNTWRLLQFQPTPTPTPIPTFNLYVSETSAAVACAGGDTLGGSGYQFVITGNTNDICTSTSFICDFIYDFDFYTFYISDGTNSRQLSRVGMDEPGVEIASPDTNCSVCPTPTPTPPLDFTININNSPYNVLLNVGGSYTDNTNNVVIARTATNTFVALSSQCTHSGVGLEYQHSNNRFYCPGHGCNFNTTGSVLNGPASVPLKTYTTSLSGSLLRVYENNSPTPTPTSTLIPPTPTPTPTPTGVPATSTPTPTPIPAQCWMLRNEDTRALNFSWTRNTGEIVTYDMPINGILKICRREGTDLIINSPVNGILGQYNCGVDCSNIEDPSPCQSVGSNCFPTNTPTPTNTSTPTPTPTGTSTPTPTPTMNDSLSILTVNDLAADIVTGVDADGRPQSAGTTTYYSLVDNTIIDSTDSDSTNWDIAFSGTKILVNNGTSGPGLGGAFVYVGLFDELNTIPVDSIFATDNSNTASYAIPLGSGNGWYTYNPIQNLVTPLANRVLVIRTANGKYAKVEILNYYQGGVTLEPTASENDKLFKQRYYTFRYTYQPNGSNMFSSTPNPTPTISNDPIVFSIDIDPGANIYAALGATQEVKITVTSIMPTAGVTVDIVVKKDSDNSTVSSSTLTASTEVPINGMISNLATNVVCTATITVTSASDPTNIAIKSFKIARK